MQRAKYTEKQILCGLYEYWIYQIGTDTPFDADTRIDLHMKSDSRWATFSSWSELDLSGIFDDLERFFQFECTLEEWLQYFKLDIPITSNEEWEQIVAPGFTFGALARFIQNRATTVISFQPVTVINRECAPAGAFYGIRQVADEVSESVYSPHRFAPSTKIIDVFRGYALEKFWSQLRWMTEQRVPEIPSSWRDVNAWGCLACFLGIVAAILLSILTENSLYLIVLSVSAVAVWYGTLLYKHYSNPLPSDLQTFRDLAIFIANSDCDAVRTS
ncbi:MAG: hypothetical protein K0U86_03740 [Planctomycetes bacterium]|nr:hypothetical protein [Planctomycetota bacterium]MCH9723997.1 hypothetical protein [Planctomycetota bacterium]MCH9779539.1 hypothetical protein [Planctomycetota bacterium]MCH9792383.1 hypothetical protein [Planctomycetota bacterium]